MWIGADMLTAEERSLRSSIAANARWAKVRDRRAATQAARDAQWRRLEDEVDPDRLLSPGERSKRVQNLFRANQQRLALRSVRARRLK